RVPHAEHVDLVAGFDPETLTGVKPAGSEQAAEPRPVRVGRPEPVGKDTSVDGGAVQGGRHQRFFVIVARSPSLSIAGPTVTLKSARRMTRAGRMKRPSGNSTLMGSWRAASSARWRRRVRSRSACVRSVFDMLAPSLAVEITRPVRAFTLA